MRIPHPPTGLTPAQILAYTTAFLLALAALIAAAIFIPPVGLVITILLGIAVAGVTAWFGMALYNDHADRRAQRELQRQRIQPGEILQIQRENVTLLIDPQRSASPAIAITDQGITPLLPVDAPQLARNTQAAAVQLAQAAPQGAGRWSEMIQERQAPAQIHSVPVELPAIEAPQHDLATMQVDLLQRLQLASAAGDVLLGIDATGQEVRGTLHDLMHTGLLAATGGGKTTTLSALALQLAYDPQVEMVVADPHLMELALLEDTGALRFPLPNNGKEAVMQLTALANEIRRRAELVNTVSQRIKEIRGRREILQRLDRYNRAAGHIGAEQLPALVAFGDEIKALATLGPEADTALNIITSEGRKFGVYFIGASQSWKADVVNTDVRQQFWTRYCLPGASVQQTAALFEIGQPEARKVVAQLTAPGVAALWRRGGGVQVIKTPFIDLESDRAYRVIENIAAHRERQGTPDEWAVNVPPFTAHSSEAMNAVLGHSDGLNQYSSAELLPAEKRPFTPIHTPPGWEIMNDERPETEIPEEEKRQIVELAQQGLSRGKIADAVYGGRGKYDRVKTVLDQAGL